MIHRPASEDRTRVSIRTKMQRVKIENGFTGRTCAMPLAFSRWVSGNKRGKSETSAGSQTRSTLGRPAYANRYGPWKKRNAFSS
ncbi:hypothetical protein TNCT_167161 [Trichonephila clavata]|uniref:Uncharacterized protein n=1 Tax=Trichonephila clavata TaxID=2740835 RepID=A0A8X6GXS0_TRICU|nr:hypothetical protein TNCT_167161 [Trichonephila clavata]